MLIALFAACWLGQSLTGWADSNEERQLHGQARRTWSAYVASGDFLEATFENWESEFFQMTAFLVLSALLIQRGSSESKKPPDEEVDRETDEGSQTLPRDAPWPVHRGGLALRLYSRSLSIALGALFLLSFALHGWFGLQKTNEDARLHGAPTRSLWAYVTSATFWFESLQNWQSEFLSVAALVLLSIFLRQKGSPQSKPVHAPHRQTGT